jgi:hypothetical protein
VDSIRVGVVGPGWIALVAAAAERALETSRSVPVEMP